MDIPTGDFYKKLEAVNYVPKDKAELEKTIPGAKPNYVSLKKLNELIEKQKPKPAPGGVTGALGAPGQLPGKISTAQKGATNSIEARSKFATFEVTVQKNINKISDYLQRKGMTTE